MKKCQQLSGESSSSPGGSPPGCYAGQRKGEEVDAVAGRRSRSSER